MRSTSSTSRARRGFTFVEVLIASTLTALLFGLVAMAFAPTLRNVGRSLLQAELQQQVDTTLRWIEGDLKRTVGGGVGLLPPDPDLPQQPVALGIVRLDTVASDGRQVWETQAVVYVWDRTRKRLIRRVYPPEPPTGLDVTFSAESPLQLAPEALLPIATELNNDYRILATGVQRFEVTHGGASDTAIEPPLAVTLELGRPLPGGRDTDLETWSNTVRVAFRLSRTGR